MNDQIFNTKIAIIFEKYYCKKNIIMEFYEKRANSKIFISSVFISYHEFGGTKQDICSKSLIVVFLIIARFAAENK